MKADRPAELQLPREDDAAPPPAAQVGTDVSPSTGATKQANANTGGRPLPAVALIEPVGSHGGMDYYDCGLAGAWGERGGRCVWYTCDVSEPRGTRPVEVVRSFIAIWGGEHRLLRAWRYIGGLVSALRDARRRGLEVAHLHIFHSGPLEVLAVLLARLAGLAVVVTVHDVESFRPGSSSAVFRRLIYGAAARLVVHNRATEAELRALSPGVAHKLRVVSHGSYLGLVPALTPRAKARFALGLAPAEPVVLFFGQIKEIKGLDLLIHAFGELRRSIGACRLVIAGKVWKSDFAQYQALIDAQGIGPDVIAHVRYIDDAQMPRYYGAADVVVLPYRRIYQSGVLLMAMSLGVPVLASDLPGMADVVVHGRNGYLFRAGDASDLARVLKAVLSDDAGRAAVSARALEDMHTRYGWAAIARLLGDVYSDARRIQSRRAVHLRET